MKKIGVDCRFSLDGTVMIKRINVDGRLLPVEPGRQWIDGAGRHVLVSTLDGKTSEIILNRETLNWFLSKSIGQGREIV